VCRKSPSSLGDHGDKLRPKPVNLGQGQRRPSGPDEAERSGRRAIAAPVEPGQVKRAVDQDGAAAVRGLRLPFLEQH
jgi:hypothetical protein